MQNKVEKNITRANITLNETNFFIVIEFGYKDKKLSAKVHFDFASTNQKRGQMKICPR